MKRMLIERGAMGQIKEVKLEDIADSLGVSIVTVSNALKGKKGVSEGLRNRIKEAAQRMGYKTPVYEEKEKAIQLTYAEKAESYIETNYSYPITVEEIASYVGISRSHLFRSFQNYMNRSPKEYLTEYRIKQACRLLRETDLSVSAIAYSVGFENNLYFSKAFRKQKGESPSEYRKSRVRKI